MARRPAPSVDGRRIPGTKGVGGAVETTSLIPSSLATVDPTLVRNLDNNLVAGQRSTASLFVFYVKEGQTSLTDVVANMVSIPIRGTVFYKLGAINWFYLPY